MVETSTPTPPWRFNGHRLDIKRWIPTFFSSHKTLFTVLWIAAFASVFVWQRNIVDGFSIFRWAAPARAMPRLRPVAFNLTDFGGVGDGVTLNTEAFERAVSAISKLMKKGGGQLNVPAGNWLTAPFNLTSHMTLFLAEGAVILGIDGLGILCPNCLFHSSCNDMRPSVNPIVTPSNLPFYPFKSHGIFCPIAVSPHGRPHHSVWNCRRRWRSLHLLKQGMKKKTL